MIDAATGAEALRLAADEQPSLVVLDIRLPDLNGFEVCKRLKSDPRTQAIPVLHVSAVGRAEDDMPEALEYQSDAYLREPIDPNTLVATARALIRAREAERRQHEAEERAGQAVRHSAHILASIADPIVAFDKEWRYTYVSHRAAAAVGKTPEEMIGKSIWELFPDYLDSEFRDACNRAWAESKPVTVERYSNVLGIWVESYIYPFEDGAATQWRDITERKRAEQALQASEERYRTLFNSIDQGFCIFEMKIEPGEPLDYRFIEVNQSFEKQSTLVNATGKWMRELRPAHEEKWFEIYRDVAVTGQPIRFEQRGQELENRWFELYAFRMGAPEEKRVGVLFTDISERKRAEEALRASEERYRTLFTSMSEGFALGEAVCDENGNPIDCCLIAVNAAYERQTGLGREILGRPLRKVLPNLEAVWIDKYSHVASTGEQVRFEEYNRDTGRHYSVFCYSPSPGRFAVLFRDITDIRQAEEALRESERQFRELAEFMPQLVWMTDRSGAMTYFNHRWYEQMGVGPDESLGERWAELLHPEDRSRSLNYWHSCLATGELYEIEHRFRVASGEYRSFLGRAAPFRDEQGRITRWFGTCTDIEDNKRAEERLRQTQKLESVGLLAGGIAHDFNNLLTGIMGHASLVLGEVGAGPAERIKEVIGSAERAASLTRQLLAYSGKGRFIVQDVDVSQAVHEMSDLVEFSIPKSVDLALNVQRRLPTVRMDPSQLQQILMNLVINAGEAIGEGNPGRITVTTSVKDVEKPFVDAIGQEVAAGRYVSIEVVDTGAGIDEAAKSRLFDPFFTTKFTGRGLGLAATAGIVRSQKGAITVESVPGDGSAFRVLLPVAGGRVQNAEEQPGAEGRATVLVVEDEVSVRGFIATAVRRLGYRVLTATDGGDALAICDRERREIDLAITDVVMPIMGGSDLLPALRARQPKMKILLTSGYSEAEARRLCAAYPGAAFIQKPYTAQQIAKAVEKLLGVTRQ